MGGVLGFLPDVFSDVSALLLAVTVAVITYFLYNQVRDSETWEKYGVKQGNMGITDLRTGFTKLMEEHGDTVGMKRGVMMLLTRDLSILKQVMVKDFNNFVDRAFNLNTNSVLELGLFFLQGQDWRRIKQIMSPAFSSGKLKLVSKTVDETAQKLAKVMEDCARNGQPVAIKHSIGQYTGEIIAKTAFGIHTDCLGGEDDEFTNYAKTLLKSRNKIMSKIMLFFLRFPDIHRFVLKKLKITLIDPVSKDANVYLTSILHKSIAERQEYVNQKGKKPSDLFQSLLSAKTAGDQVMKTGEQNGPGGEKKAKTLSYDELLGQSLLIILAAFETTATTLQMCLYMLAKHPEVQEKVIKEIDEVVASDSPTPEELRQLKYMEQVINETLRLYPPAPVINRKATQTRSYGDITIPKGASVIIPIFLVLKDPKHFPDPEKFDPDRFTEENKAKRDPMAFMSFGYGPRLCIGMRLAYLELKIALVHLFKKIRVALSDRTVPKMGEDIRLKPLEFLQLEDSIQLEVKL